MHRALSDFLLLLLHLQAFVFVSTAFSQPHGQVIEEKYYQSFIEPVLMDRIAEKIDPDELDAISPKYLSFAHPF